MSNYICQNHTFLMSFFSHKICNQITTEFISTRFKTDTSSKDVLNNSFLSSKKFSFAKADFRQSSFDIDFISFPQFNKER